MFNQGDTVTISRGKFRGPATIVTGADNGEYAVKTQSGHLTIVKAENLKAPAESTVTESRLAAEIQTLSADESDSPEVQHALAKLVSRLSGDMPGLGARISWPMVDEPDEIQR